MSSKLQLGLLMHPYANQAEPFGNLTAFAERVSCLAEELEMVVVGFGPRHIDWEQGRIHGVACQGGSGNWRPVVTDLPDVVWSRYFRRDPTPELERLAAAGVEPFNAGSMNKWEAYCHFKQDPVMKQHLPETALLTEVAVLWELLKRYPVVFIKPIAGSVGKGIIRASRRERDRVRVRYVSQKSGELRRAVLTKRELAVWLSRKNRAGRYIAQRGLDLALFGQRPADLRVLVQKDGTGAWSITGMGARVAAPGRFTSNLHTGGQGLPVEQVLNAVAPGDSARQDWLRRRIEELVLHSVESLERALGQLGEIGFDLGLDAEGGLWYLEHNAQPGRTIFEQIGRPDLADLAHRRPVEYARMLALRRRSALSPESLDAESVPSSPGCFVGQSGGTCS